VGDLEHYIAVLKREAAALAVVLPAALEASAAAAISTNETANINSNTTSGATTTCPATGIHTLEQQQQQSAHRTEAHPTASKNPGVQAHQSEQAAAPARAAGPVNQLSREVTTDFSATEHPAFFQLPVSKRASR